jgi:hypothetical protein
MTRAGLDSTTALSVMQTLKAIAARGECLVVSTIHQVVGCLPETVNRRPAPLSALTWSVLVIIIGGSSSSSSVMVTETLVLPRQPQTKIFQLFDRLVLLNRGSLVYQGPQEGAVPFFEAQGSLCPPATNPGDYLIDALTAVGDKAKGGDPPPKPDIDTIIRSCNRWLGGLVVTVAGGVRVQSLSTLSHRRWLSPTTGPPAPPSSSTSRRYIQEPVMFMIMLIVFVELMMMVQ